jgi:molecular chaperone HscB
LLWGLIFPDGFNGRYMISDVNHFETLEIHLSFRPDKNLLKTNFYRLSREYHPDFYTLDSEEKKDEILTKSGQINTAYKILSDESSRMKYILEHYQLLSDADNLAMDPLFLAEMMEINEAIFELEMDFDSNSFSKIKSMVDRIENELKSMVEKDIHDFENQINTRSSLEKIKEYYLKSKYLLRISENLATFAISKDS